MHFFVSKVKRQKIHYFKMVHPRKILLTEWMFCRAGNKYIPERKRSRPNILFRERTFLFRDRTVQIEEKNSPLEEKEEAETFCIEGILVSCPTDTFFYLSNVMTPTKSLWSNDFGSLKTLRYSLQSKITQFTLW